MGINVLHISSYTVVKKRDADACGGVVVTQMSCQCIIKKSASCLVNGWEALHVRQLGLEVLQRGRDL